MSISWSPDLLPGGLFSQKLMTLSCKHPSVKLLPDQNTSERLVDGLKVCCHLSCSVGSWGGALVVWAVSGVAAMLGALSWAELAAAHPRQRMTINFLVLFTKFS